MAGRSGSECGLITEPLRGPAMERSVNTQFTSAATIQQGRFRQPAVYHLGAVLRRAPAGLNLLNLKDYFASCCSDGGALV
jgi:hypothetical protein